MYRTILAATFCASLSLSEARGQAIAQLPAATAPSGDEQVEVVQAGVSKRMSVAQVASQSTRVGVAGSGGGSLSLGNQSYAGGRTMKIDNLWSDDGINPAHEGAIWPTATYAANAITRTFTGSTVSGQGTALIVNGPLTPLFVTAFNNGASAQVTGIVQDCDAMVAGGSCFGGNDIARTNSAISASLRGREIDLEFSTGSRDGGDSFGLGINGFNIANSAPALVIGVVGGGTWANGIVGSGVRGSYFSVNSSNTTTAASFINTTSGTFSNAPIVLGKGAGQSINFGGGSFGTDTYIYGDAAHTLNINMGAGGFVAFRNPGGTVVATLDQHGTLKEEGTSFASLARCSGGVGAGQIAYITDASAPITAWHQQVTAGGGSNMAFVACNGNGWYAFDY